MWSKTFLIPVPCFLFGNIPLTSALKTFCLPLKGIIGSLWIVFFFSFLTDSFDFADPLKVSTSPFNLICSSSESSNYNYRYKFLFQKILYCFKLLKIMFYPFFLLPVLKIKLSLLSLLFISTIFVLFICSFFI